MATKKLSILRNFIYLSFVIALLVSITASANSDLTGVVHTINVNKTWGGIFIQLENAPHFEVGSACEKSWAYIPISDEYAKLFLSLAMVSKSTKQPIRIGTKGCVTTPVNPSPIIDWIDDGIRIGS